jgi:penicillin amidase
LGGAWYIHIKQPVRSGAIDLRGLQQEVTVRYAERGVPHIQAQNDTDQLFRTLGIRAHALQVVQTMDMGTPEGQALSAYLVLAHTRNTLQFRAIP